MIEPGSLEANTPWGGLKLTGQGAIVVALLLVALTALTYHQHTSIISAQERLVQSQERSICVLTFMDEDRRLSALLSGDPCRYALGYARERLDRRR